MKNIIFFLIIFFPSLSLAQKVKYKDLFPVLLTLPDEAARQKISTYLIDEQDHPNANMRLALIYERGYKSADKLTEYKKALAFAERSKLRFAKCRQLIDEKEVLRNEEYYASFSNGLDKKGRPIVSYNLVNQKMINGYDSADLLLKKLPPIFNNFTAAVNSYGKAHQTFFDINNRYKNLDDLYMLYDENLKNELQELKSSMDTAIARLEIYKRLIAEYPIEGYNQKYELADINYYRLDGLSELSNFLNDNVRLWNYSKWVDQIFEVVGSDISKLREGLVAYDNSLTKNLEQLARQDNVTAIDANNELLYQLKKYDFHSLPVALLNYKQVKQNLLKREIQKIVYDTATNSAGASKNNFYSNLIHQTVISDSLLSVAMKYNMEENTIKYQDFFRSNYGGSSGFDLYLKKEKDELKKDFNYFSLTLRNDLIDEINLTSTGRKNWANYKNQELALFINAQDSVSLASGGVITNSLKYRTDSSAYIGGYKDQKGRLISFVARIDPSKKVLWMKEFDYPVDSASSAGVSQIKNLEVTKDGCAVIISSFDSLSHASSNNFLYLNDEGEVKYSLPIKSASTPQKILLDQDNSRFVLVFKDTSSLITESILSIYAINTLGDRLWEREFSYAGDVVNFHKIQDGFLLIGNFTMVKDIEGNIFRTKGQLKESNSFALRMTNAGDFEFIKIFTKPFSYYLTNTYKVNDGNINLFGYKGTFDNRQELSFENESILHLMLDKDLTELSLE